MEGVFNEGFATMALGWKIWLNWMMLINTVSIYFAIKETPARIILVVWIFNACTMMVAAEFVGFTRILGLVHVVYWTPLAFYMYGVIRKSTARNMYYTWLLVLLVTIIASLLIDYVDVVRYLLGDRGTP